MFLESGVIYNEGMNSGNFTMNGFQIPIAVTVLELMRQVAETTVSDDNTSFDKLFVLANCGPFAVTGLPFVFLLRSYPALSIIFDSFSLVLKLRCYVGGKDREKDHSRCCQDNCEGLAGPGDTEDVGAYRRYIH